MKAVLISIQPKWCEKIASGRKTLELRKSIPRVGTPFKVYIYCTKRNGFTTVNRNNDICDGKVIGEFICDYILHGCHMGNADIAEAQSCVSREDIFQYSNGEKVYGWHISNLVIYDKPKELTDYYGKCNKPVLFDCSFCSECGTKTCKTMTRAPQSWCYVENWHEVRYDRGHTYQR